MAMGEYALIAECVSALQWWSLSTILGQHEPHALKQEQGEETCCVVRASQNGYFPLLRDGHKFCFALLAINVETISLEN